MACAHGGQADEALRYLSEARARGGDGVAGAPLNAMCYASAIYACTKVSVSSRWVCGGMYAASRCMGAACHTSHPPPRPTQPTDALQVGRYNEALQIFKQMRPVGGGEGASTTAPNAFAYNLAMKARVLQGKVRKRLY